MTETTRRICLVPKLSGIGGMVSFQNRLAQGLIKRGIQVCYELSEGPFSAVLVVGGTRNLAGLRSTQRRGARIIQRLDGMNWLHRLRRTGVRHFLRAEYGNMILGLIRSHLADGVVYQSKFAKEWWERVRGRLPRPTWVVYNGVDLNLFTPSGPNKRPDDYCRLLLVEGRLGGGYEIGLEMAVRLAERLAQSLEKESRQRVELIIVGRVDKKTSEHWRREAHIPIHFAGEVAQSNIPEIDRSAHLLYSADLNAACPNSVIEALACGLPVISFDTGAIPELVGYDAGKVVPYGGNPWRLDPPDLDALSQAALAVMLEYGKYRQGARNQAEALFSLDKMVEGYLQALQEG